MTDRVTVQTGVGSLTDISDDPRRDHDELWTQVVALSRERHRHQVVERKFPMTHVTKMTYAKFVTIKINMAVQFPDTVQERHAAQQFLLSSIHRIQNTKVS